MSLISPNFDVKSIIFPNFGQGPFPKIAGKSPVVGNPQNRFSCNEAYIVCFTILTELLYQHLPQLLPWTMDPEIDNERVILFAHFDRLFFFYPLVVIFCLLITFADSLGADRAKQNVTEYTGLGSFSIINNELFSIKRGFYKSSQVLMNLLNKLNSIVQEHKC